MRNYAGFCFILVATIIFSGCVSKKKYLAMETLKNQYVRQSESLSKENKSLKSDLESAESEFEALKQNLHFSDTKKDEQLAVLARKLEDMEKNFNRAQTELSRTRDLYKDQRFYNTQASNEITRLEFAIEQLKRDTVSLNYSLRLSRERNSELQQRVEERVDQINEKNTEIARLKNDLAAGESSVGNLQNQITVLETKLETISTSFIELRKELLRAKSSGTPIDPNTEPNVQKIGTELGHY